MFTSRDDNRSSREAQLEAFAYIIAAIDLIIDFYPAIALIYVINQQSHRNVALVESYVGDLVGLGTLGMVGERGGASEPAESFGLERPDVPLLNGLDWVAAHAADRVRGHGRHIRTTGSDVKAY